MVGAMAPLSGIPRIALGHGPTPLERLDRVSALLGVEVWIKRDDLTGLALGGNKVRKLEYLLAEARAQGHDTIVTVGGVQSNHARQTAAAAARLGLRCELVLPRLVPGRSGPYEETGNVLLDHLLGARVHLVDDADAATTRVTEILAEVGARGGSAAFFPAGGSTATGALGYARAALELSDQAREVGISFDRIVLAVSTGGTLAGLVVGLALAAASTAAGAEPGARNPTALTGIAVSGPASAAADAARSLADQAAARVDVALSRGGVEVRDGYLGDGYGLATAAMREAVATCARLEGLLLDPVYTGKAMAGLFDLARRGEIEAKERVLFWHTGGTPALFAYPELVAELPAPPRR
jgi:D-cysteine desulfhydrase family pyridoxal phosphate-dependent enzyme